MVSTQVVLEIALFDVDLVQPNCAFRGWGFAYSFYLQCALPGVFAVVFFVPIGVRALRRVADGAVRTRRDFARLFDHYDGDLGAATSHAIKTFFITLDVCHTTITFKSLQVWRCDEYANGESFLPGQDKRAKFPTSKAPFSAGFHSFRLILGRAIISRNGLEAWMLFHGTRARGTLTLKRR